MLAYKNYPFANRPSSPLLNDGAQYEALQAWLTEKEGFTRTTHSAFCLLYQGFFFLKGVAQ
jgi:hypothetical protein